MLYGNHGAPNAVLVAVVVVVSCNPCGESNKKS